MSGITKEWIVFLSFFLFVAGYTFAEAFWLNRKGRASFATSLGFSMLTNFIGFTVGFFVFFVIFGVVLAMAWDGSIKNFPLHDYGLAIAIGLGLLFTPALLTVCKRIFLKILKIQSGKSAWLYSLASSVVGLTASLGAPILLGYLFSR
jgi:hypothetical protein